MQTLAVGAMEIREFAERILWGETLEDKLVTPEILTDTNPSGGYFNLSHPKRPESLRLDRWRHESKVVFPSIDSLGDDRMRGRVFHFFANHELLALELMALALLKFPDAEPKFRRGIVSTLIEEQKHMRLYMEHMASLKVEFGEIPVNDYFWSCLSTMTSPLDFVTHMSLTFEQANLDYSLYYAKAFNKVGDERGGAILDVVFREEVGHVKHGFAWFQKWRDAQLSDWDAYVKLLRFPLTPSRAKGLHFLPEVRRDIGLSEQFINELRVFSHTKGRPPRIFVYNPCVEYEAVVPNFVPNAKVQTLERDFEALPMFLAGEFDITLVTKKPSTEFLLALRECYFSVCEFVTYEGLRAPRTEALPNALENRPFEKMIPWGQSPAISQRFGLNRPSVSNEIYSKAYASDFARNVVNDLGLSSCPPFALSVVCRSEAEVANAVGESLSHAPTCVLKSPFSSAGRDRVFSDHQVLSRANADWVRKMLLRFGSVVVQPWLNKLADFSVQARVENGKTNVVAVTRFLTDGRGCYIGTVLGKALHGLDGDVLRFLHGGGSTSESVFATFEHVAQKAGIELSKLGYEGPFGIDGMLFRYGPSSALGFHPCLEINPRHTMGLIAHSISRRCVPGRLALWIQVQREQVESAGFEGFLDLARFAKANWAPQVTHTQVRSGVVFTNDPSQAQEFVTLLIVGEECVSQFFNTLKFMHF